MALTSLAVDTTSGVPVELYQDNFSLQYAVEVGGIPFYDSCDQAQARGVYEFLLGMSNETLAGLVAGAPDGGYGQHAEMIERLAGVGQ